MANVLVREDYALEVQCEYCHLSPTEAVAVLRLRLEHKQKTQACGGCVRRMADEALDQMHRRGPA